ncbi:type II toxin-antitoxin system VapC family toxin [Nocardia sp. BMG51109]|uniref:type II toxin-antitoxin system VapC family toxin n=1 Tax=Nocardia sp. BMG51109 TaxID=1056816 RepID=UPI00046443B4|nr:type II toxin-antitoxin system VapC family toxin [Nocardia sp. BMG51109]
MRNYLLDTVAVSEWMKARPDAGLERWQASADEDRLHLSVMTLAEIRKGVELMTESRRRNRLTEWLTGPLVDRFSGRVLPVDTAVADAWGRLVARARSNGTSVADVDALIAATAKVHNLTVVTRNVRHFEPMGVPVVDPWGQ